MEEVESTARFTSGPRNGYTAVWHTQGTLGK